MRYDVRNGVKLTVCPETFVSASHIRGDFSKLSQKQENDSGSNDSNLDEKSLFLRNSEFFGRNDEDGKQYREVNKL